ncbi:hypothetical protein [Treponema sp.]|uniref:hypothetical protein n=1 Tax=Treponema sp. TaxID=166 RepID=UPI0025FE9A00|nr:hypothetical protein [Treponema sp.]MCR5219282.1 hypothetical protein [Treponema sp.]
MNKILKILSILVIGFVMFSCETPTDNPVEETPEEPTYSITFIKEIPEQQPLADLLNSSPDYKNLKEGTEVELPKVIYLTLETEQIALEPIDSSTHEGIIHYEGNITSVVIGNEDVEIKFRVWGWAVLQK